MAGCAPASLVFLLCVGGGARERAAGASSRRRRLFFSSEPATLSDHKEKQSIQLHIYCSSTISADLLRVKIKAN